MNASAQTPPRPYALTALSLLALVLFYGPAEAEPEQKAAQLRQTLARETLQQLEVQIVESRYLQRRLIALPKGFDERRAWIHPESPQKTLALAKDLLDAGFVRQAWAELQTVHKGQRPADWLKHDLPKRCQSLIQEAFLARSIKDRDTQVQLVFRYGDQWLLSNSKLTGLPQLHLETFNEAEQCVAKKPARALALYRMLLTKIDKDCLLARELKLKRFLTAVRVNHTRTQEFANDILPLLPNLSLELTCLTDKQALDIGEKLRETQDLKNAGVAEFYGPCLTVREAETLTKNAIHEDLCGTLGKTLSQALEARARVVLKALQSILPPVSLKSLKDWRRLADYAAIYGVFDLAAPIYLRVSNIKKDPELSFLALASKVQALCRDQKSKKSVNEVIQDWLKANPKSPHFDAARLLRAQCLIDEAPKSARAIFQSLCERGESLSHDKAKQWLAALDQQRLGVEVKERWTASGKIPVALTLRNISSLKITLSRIEEVFEAKPETQKNTLSDQIEEFLRKQRAAPLKELKTEGLKTPAPKYAKVMLHSIRISLPSPGLYRVSIHNDAVSASFIACYQDIEGRIICTPKRALAVFENRHTGLALGGLSMVFREKITRTNDRGLGVVKAADKHCKLCHGPCDYCLTCENKNGRSGLVLFRKGLLVKAETDRLVRIPGIPKPLTRLYLVTDRPLYQGGEVIHFKGMLVRQAGTLGLNPKQRYKSVSGEQVTMTLENGSDVLHTSTVRSNEFGCFSGHIDIPKDCSRSKHIVKVVFNGEHAQIPIEIRDFEKPDSIIRMTKTDKGVEVFAGFVWGQPMPGTELKAMVADSAIAVKLNSKGQAFIPAKDGELVTLVLKKGARTLQYEEFVYRRPLSSGATKAPEPEDDNTKVTKAKSEKASPKAKATSPKAAKDEPRMSIVKIDSQQRFARLSLKCQHAPWTALLWIGDEDVYGVRRIQSDTKETVIDIALSPAFDPGVTVVALFQTKGKTLERQLNVPCRAAELQVSISSNTESYKPRQRAQVKVQARDAQGRGQKAESCLAVVDDAIFAIKADASPHIYRKLYPKRDFQGSIAGIGSYTLGSIRLVSDQKLPLDVWRAINIRYRHYQYDLIRQTVSFGESFRSVAPSAWGQRWGKGSLSREGGSEGTESAVSASLRWLKRHQDSESAFCRCPGSPTCSKLNGQLEPLARDALALMAFLGCGHTHRFGTFKRTVSKVLRRLIKHQDTAGHLGPQDSSQSILVHSLATRALIEAYAVSRDHRIKKYVTRALNRLTQCRIPDSGWPMKKGLEANLMTTGWATQALRAAKQAGFKVPEGCWSEILNFVDECTDLRGRTRFALANTGHDLKALNSVAGQDFTATAVATRLACGRKVSDPSVRMGLRRLMMRLPTPEDQDDWCPHTIYFTTSVLFRVGGPRWRRWYRALDASLTKWQLTGGCQDGSWNPHGPWSKFFGRVSASSLNSLSLEIYYRYERLHGADNQDQLVRFHFPNTAYWNAHMRHNDQGLAEAEFEIPDTITSYRLKAHAITKDGKVGQAESWISVRQDFFVKLKTPAFFVQGDQCTITAELYNDTGKDLQGQVKLTGAGFTTKSGTQEFQSLGKVGLSRVEWQIAVSQVSEIELRLWASAGAHSDAQELLRPVLSPGEWLTVTDTQTLKEAQELTVLVPEEAITGSAKLELKIAPRDSALPDILDSLRTLIEFPHGCVEQTMSRFLPALEVSESLEELGCSKAEFMPKFDKICEAGVKRLCNFQNKNGGWGWFSNDKAKSFMTAYVVYGLSRAKALGVHVDAGVIKAGVKFLQNHYGQEKRQDMRAFMLFALAQAGCPHEQAGEVLQQKLSPYGQSLLTLALHKAGQTKLAEQSLSKLLAMKTDSGEDCFFETKNWFYKWESVNIESTAFALRAISTLNPKHPSLKKIVHWLMAQRKLGQWRSTKDTAAAILALIRTMLNTKGRRQSQLLGLSRSLNEKKSEALSTVIKLNGGRTRQLTLDPSNPSLVNARCLFGNKFLKQGQNTLSISALKKPKEPMKITSVLRYKRATKSAAVQGPLALNIEWPKALKVGSEDIVNVTVDVKYDCDYVMINIPIPAGCQIVHNSGKGQFAEFEARYEQALFFVDRLPKGQHKFSFQLKSRTAGEFTILPARAELMYNTKLKTRGVSQRVTISKP